MLLFKYGQLLCKSCSSDIGIAFKSCRIQEYWAEVTLFLWTQLDLAYLQISVTDMVGSGWEKGNLKLFWHCCLKCSAWVFLFEILFLVAFPNLYFLENASLNWTWIEEIGFLPRISWLAFICSYVLVFQCSCPQTESSLSTERKNKIPICPFHMMSEESLVFYCMQWLIFRCESLKTRKELIDDGWVEYKQSPLQALVPKCCNKCLILSVQARDIYFLLFIYLFYYS